MTSDQATRMIQRFDDKRRALPKDEPERTLYGNIVLALAYGASVRTIAKQSAKFHRQFGRPKS